MNQKVKNAIWIKFRTLMDSVAIRLTLIIMLIASVVVAFWPFVKGLFSEHDLVNIETSISMEEFEAFNLETNTKDDADIRIEIIDGIYQVDVLTRKGYTNINNVMNYLKSQNITDLIENGNLTEEQFIKATNQNIKINYEYENKLGQNGYDFLMAFILLFNFLVILLVSRIGAQVAYEKGNKVTEVILTSLTGEQLFYAEIISSIAVVILNLVLVSAPLVIAFLVNNPEICTDLSFFTLGKLGKFLIHLIITTISLVMCIIGFCSRVKQSEDSNAYTALVIIPLYFSLVYLIFNIDIFRGWFYLLNFIPISSMFPVLGAVLNETISGIEFAIIEIGVIVFIVIEYFFIKRMFVKNIFRR